MNRLKSIVYFNQRGYRNIIRNQSLKNGRKSKPISEEQLYQNFEETEFEVNEDDNDLEKLEADFLSADKIYDEHTRELQYNKEILKGRIVAKKYFKSKEPSFLTWSERDQIKTLHNKNDKEWTPERLSAAFPALPETIKKVIKTPYMPKTAEAVIKYDQNVVDNWNQLKAGKLVLSQELEAHLQKFKNRNIQAINLKAIAEKFVKPKPTFASPQSQLFTNIVKDYTKSNNMIEEKPLLQLNDSTVTNNTTSSDLIVHNGPNKIKLDRKYATSDVFLERKINKIVDHSNLSVEDKFFVQEYKDKKTRDYINDVKESIATKPNKTLELKENIEITEPSVVSNETLEPQTMQDKTPNTPKPLVMQEPSEKIETYRHSLETGIIKWEKKSVSNEKGDYPQYIKVPYHKAKKGVTFKVNDCYYDSDGEFLYRIPGLKLK